ncbi:NAD-dependent glyceraldehyde-3-phosphate dehydrogenase [hydrothermal vent metagenome]|uniref:NAD-dependent glyceraldehyde-3-phosphate dehydrogenase n=1 Tax=hydrothermal vent metagenome TaxID=652676 RepID=A0A3B1E7I3_9ZZZZ
MRILLNGVGRIGKAIVRIANSCETIKIIAINELNSNIDNIAYSINYDSTYGRFEDKFEVVDDYIQNNKSNIKILNCKNLEDIDFELFGIDIIIDASGSKVDNDILKSLLVKAIFITNPNQDANINIVLGINEEKLDLNKHKIISTSSCNATALLPILKLIDDKYGIEYGDITTIHPLLNHQKVLDSTCVGNYDRKVECNFEFGRSSIQNIIPSTTTTVDACSYVLPHINSTILSSSSLRVPIHVVGAINITLTIKNKSTKDTILMLCKEYESNQKHKILLNSYEPLVSSDFQMQHYTSIIDHRFTDVKKNNMIKFVVWHDNEWGYASKVVDILKYYDKISCYKID